MLTPSQRLLVGFTRSCAATSIERERARERRHVSDREI